MGYHDSDVDTSANQLHLVLEYCSGGDLSDRIVQQQQVQRKGGGDSGLVDEPTILKWFIELALALDYIHSLNILHRDIKTQNIFIGADGVLKLGDFGISKVLSSDADMARTVIGTPYYLSPEICEGKTCTVFLFLAL